MRISHDQPPVSSFSSFFNLIEFGDGVQNTGICLVVESRILETEKETNGRGNQMKKR